jgi:hypothetical protein
MTFCRTISIVAVIFVAFVWKRVVTALVLVGYAAYYVSKFFQKLPPPSAISEHLRGMEQYKEENADEIYAQARASVYKRYLRRVAREMSRLNPIKEE